jgi:hypothetical protein
MLNARVETNVAGKTLYQSAWPSRYAGMTQ